MPKKVRLYVNGKRHNDVYLNRTKWQVFLIKVKRILKLTFWTCVVIGIAWLIYFVGSLKEAKIVEVQVEPETPVLERIAKCESPSGHFDKNGQVALYGNKNGSSDIGKYMINNRIWGKKATELGLNLMLEADQEVFARYLYRNYGTEPWYLTKHCWNK